jgi:hypothetical protein
MMKRSFILIILGILAAPPTGYALFHTNGKRIPAETNNEGFAGPKE